MADANVTISNNQVDVTFLGSDLIGPLVADAQAARDEAVNLLADYPSTADASAGRIAVLGLANAAADNKAAVLYAARNTSGSAVVTDVSDLGNLWQDNGSTPVTAVGQTVARIDDLSEQGHHLYLGNGGTLRQTDEGRYYVECGNQAFYSDANLTVTANALLVAALARTVNDSWKLITVANASAHGMWINNLNNLGRLSCASTSSDGSPSGLDSRSGAFPIDQFGVIDYRLSPLQHSSWLQGSGRSNSEIFYQYDFGNRIASSPWQSATTATNCTFGITTSGTAGTAGACDFMGSAFFGQGVQGTVRKAANDWFCDLTGQNDTLSHFHTGVMTFGQSIAQGASGTGNLGPAVPLGHAAMFMDWDRAQPLADPVQQAVANIALEGSMWPAFANAFYPLDGNPPLIIGCAVSGAGIHVGPTIGGVLRTWGPTGTLTEIAVEKTLRAIEWMNEYSPGCHVPLMLYQGGQQDVGRFSSGSSTVSSYADDMIDLFDRIRTQTGISDMQCGIISGYKDESTPANDPWFEDLNEAEALAAAETNNFLASSAAETLTAAGSAPATADGIHWDQDFNDDIADATAPNSATALGYY